MSARARWRTQGCQNPSGRKAFNQESVAQRRRTLLSYLQKKGKLFRTESDAAALTQSGLGETKESQVTHGSLRALPTRPLTRAPRSRTR
jgi:hypothetical protein